MKLVVQGQDLRGEPRCTRPDLSGSLAVYCFGDAPADERDAFETHLLECDFCWREVQRLDSLVRILRTDKSLTRRHYLAEIVSMAGISSKLRTLLGGHWLHALAICSIYALMLSVSVFMEVAYDYGRLGTVAWTAAPIVFVWVVCTTIAALIVDWKLTASGRRSGLSLSAAVLILAATGLYLGLKPFLPSHSVTEAAFQTWTAQAAYLKGLVYCGLFTALFGLVPFHFVLTIQRELRSGRYRFNLDLLTGSKLAVAPDGAPYVRVLLLGASLLLGAIYSLLSTAHLLEALKETEFSNLFIQTIQIRWALFLILGLECVGWYYSALNELKRECLAMSRLSNGQVSNDNSFGEGEASHYQ